MVQTDLNLRLCYANQLIKLVLCWTNMHYMSAAVELLKSIHDCSSHNH